MKKEMLINAVQPEECRIAIIEDGVLEELYVERTSHESYVGNIYKGRIVNIEPSIQAAFVDFGVGRNGFLHVSDVEPAYYRHLFPEDKNRQRGRRGGGRNSRPPKFERENVRLHEEEDAPALEAEFPQDDFAENELNAAPVNGESEHETNDFEAPESTEEPNLEKDELAEVVEQMEIDPEALSIGSASPVFSPTAILPPGLGEPAQISVVNEDDAVAEEILNELNSNDSHFQDELDDNTGHETADDDPAADASDAQDSNESPDFSQKESPALDEQETPEVLVAEEQTEDLENVVAETATNFGAEQTETTPGEGIVDAGAADRIQGSSETETAVHYENDDHDDEFTDADLSFSLNRDDEQEADAEDETDEDSYDSADVNTSEELEEEGELVTADVGADAQSRHFESREPAKPPRHARQSTSGYKGDDDDGYMPRRSSRGGNRRRNDYRSGGRGGRPARGGRPGGGRPGGGRPKPLIQDIFKKGQEVLVQVIKEGIGTKGPTLSTYISIAGRYLVLMPGLNRIGVSRKISSEDQRRRLRDILSALKPPKGLGFIIRTAGIDRTQKELQRDLSYLSRLWQVVVRRTNKFKAPAEIYQESDMITRTIRDTFTSDIQTIWVDEPRAFEHAKEFLQIVMPRYSGRIKEYQGSEPVFHRYNLEEEIGRIQDKTVPLRNGGSIVIEQTEALVAIDVNSGNFRAGNEGAEETAFQMNLLAAKEIARQLRLRDLGGVIVNDFIDMREERHRRGVERAVREAVKRDRARTKILRMSQFGIIEMTRQRIRPSLKRSVYEECPHCDGTSLVKTAESMSIDVMRMLQLAATRHNASEIMVQVSEDVRDYLLNRKRRELFELEDNAGTRIKVTGEPGAAPEFLEFLCYDNNGNEIPFPPENQTNSQSFTKSRRKWS